MIVIVLLLELVVQNQQVLVDRHLTAETVHSEIKQPLVVEVVEVNKLTVDLVDLAVVTVMLDLHHLLVVEQVVKVIVVVQAVTMHTVDLVVVEPVAQVVALLELTVELAEQDYNMIFQEVIIGMQLEAAAVPMLGQVAQVVLVLVAQVDQIVDSEMVAMVQRIQVLEVVLMDGLVEAQQEMVALEL